MGPCKHLVRLTGCLPVEEDSISFTGATVIEQYWASSILVASAIPVQLNWIKPLPYKRETLTRLRVGSNPTAGTAEKVTEYVA